MAAWGTKGKGAKGDASGAAEGPKGHELARTRISGEKFSGTILSWKGRFGWIKPAEEVAHPKAAERNGNLFLSSSDVQDPDKVEVGAPCLFHIFEDSSGLGAEEVVQTGPGNGKGKAGKGKGGKGWSSWGKGWDDPWSSWKGGWGGGWGGKGMKGWWGGFEKGGKGGKSGGKGGKGGQGHTLERTRITADKFLGTVAAWKGKYGWITPAEEIQHAKASQNKGLFVSSSDLPEGVTELPAGATVAYHIFEDASGLGAEQVELR